MIREFLDLTYHNLSDKTNIKIYTHIIKYTRHTHYIHTQLTKHNVSQQFYEYFPIESHAFVERGGDDDDEVGVEPTRCK